MNEKYTKARFWKCALQVNPSSYAKKYRGSEHGLNEDEYNRQLLQVCKEERIEIIGLADHGNVAQIDAIKNLLSDNGIIVFPGFEISSSEQVHFVCLFAENTSTDQLNRYLGRLSFIDPTNGTCPSCMSAEKILNTIDEIGGFIYAAHCTGKNGLLEKRCHHIWKNPLLKAAQIPGTIEALENVKSDFYRKVILNKNADYKREQPMAVVNAKDVEQPETLKKTETSCLIKMTKPCFESFKLAFQDTESRVKLNSDIDASHYSHIEFMSVTGGYLDGLYIEFSKHLNTVIGGRGTGKSTLLECIRYAIEIDPVGKNALKKHNEIIKENIGKSKALVKLSVRSSKMNGRKFTIARRYGESAVVQDEHGQVSPFSPKDILPDIEFFGQNELYEIAQEQDKKRKLLTRFLGVSYGENDQKIKETLVELKKNREYLGSALEKVAATEEEVSRLSKLEEREKHFTSLGIEKKLETIKLFEREKRLQQRIVEEELQKMHDAFVALRDVLPNTDFLSENAIEELPHMGFLKEAACEIDKLRKQTEDILAQWQEKFTAANSKISIFMDDLTKKIQDEEKNLEKTFKDIPSAEGKSGQEIGNEFHQLLKEIERIRPKKMAAENQKALVDKLQQKRKNILADLSSYRADRSAQFERSLKKLNKELNGKLKLTVLPEAERAPAIEFLCNSNLENVSTARLSWINDAEDFSPVKLVELIGQGQEALSAAGWGIPPSAVTSLMKLSIKRLLELEELELPDKITIELNTSPTGQENYRPLEKLSIGQQCTALLHLLLLKNNDPLIIDQPEDNLDNAFIADRIVAELRNSKTARQFIFATHNGNIPVFGDAEWIGIFSAADGQAFMPEEAQGGIDVPEIRDQAASILEGGKTAFNQRKVKYGY